MGTILIPRLIFLNKMAVIEPKSSTVEIIVNQ